MGPESAEGADERLHRAAAHLRHAIEAVGAARSGGAESGEEAGGGAGEADEEFAFVAGEGAELAGDAHGGGGLMGRDVEAEAREGGRHDLRVFAEERAGDGDGSFGQSGEEEGAVGETFRAG